MTISSWAQIGKLSSLLLGTFTGTAAAVGADGRVEAATAAVLAAETFDDDDDGSAAAAVEPEEDAVFLILPLWPAGSDVDVDAGLETDSDVRPIIEKISK